MKGIQTALSLALSLFQYERLRRINVELEEKLEAAEIQVKQQSVEYRTILQQKEVWCPAS